MAHGKMGLMSLPSGPMKMMGIAASSSSLRSNLAIFAGEIGTTGPPKPFANH